MITYDEIQVPTPKYSYTLINDRNFIKKIAMEFLSDAVEFHLDMCNDAGGQGVYKTFDSVKSVVEGAQESAIEMSRDALTDMVEEILNTIKATTIDVKSVVLLPDGDIDCNVKLNYKDPADDSPF